MKSIKVVAVAIALLYGLINCAAKMNHNTQDHSKYMDRLAKKGLKRSRSESGYTESMDKFVTQMPKSSTQPYWMNQDYSDIQTLDLGQAGYQSKSMSSSYSSITTHRSGEKPKTKYQKTASATAVRGQKGLSETKYSRNQVESGNHSGWQKRQEKRMGQIAESGQKNTFKQKAMQRRGRDPEVKSTIITEDFPTENLSPAYLWKY